MSNKSTILYTKKNEHWYFDQSDFSKSGKNFDAFLELDQNVMEVMIIPDSNDVHITLCGELKELCGKEEIKLPSQIIKWWHYSPDSGMVVQVDGDSDFAMFLAELKKDNHG